MPSAERGSTSIVALMVVGLAAALAMLVVEVGARLLDRAEAQTAADFAALAGASEGREGATDLANRNGAALLSFVAIKGDVHVIVRFGTTRAEAWATLNPRQP